MNKEEKINLVLRRTVQMFNEETIVEKLNSGKKLIVKFGADPSRPDLHLGHTVPLRGLRILQELGHEIVFVIGDFTAMIGDPSGKSKTRPALTFKETRKSGETYFKQVTKILDKEKTSIRYNSEWLNKMKFDDVIKLTGKYTLARLLERDDFSNRFNNNIPIGMHELLYPLMQGYDSVAINADIEFGGTDQTFNLLVGRELQRDYNQEPQDVMIFPLLVGLDGKEKMSKSLDNYIGIDESPEAMFEKSMKIPDNVLFDYFKLTTDLNLKEVQEVIDNNIVEAHKMYAREIIKMYHGEEFILPAEERYKIIANGGVPEIDDVFELQKHEIENSISLIELLVISKFMPSKSEARRMIEQGGVSLNNEKVLDVNKLITLDDFKNQEMVIQKGKRKFIKILIK
ncbi:MAG: tyrosine--tRNA ligase [Bacilli bacterium]|nr:tyrosine--tRNA ligase [Bacilli bacterium]MDD4283234.1 tyrosine--tRNA ligase [Bacilli bacterium]